MEQINPYNIQPSLFSEKHSLAIRLWHWLFFLVITASIVTVLFASTLFTIKSNIPVIREQVQQKGGIVSNDQARSIAHEYNDKLWNLHKLLGYGLCFLLLGRIFIEIVHSGEEKLSAKIRKALQLQRANVTSNKDAKHYLFVKYGYLIFYLLISIMAITGLGLAYEDVPILKANHEIIVTIHSFTQYLIYLYIFTHLIGVIRADVTENKGIISGMVNGNKQGGVH